LIDSFKSKNTMLFNTIDTVEYKLNEFEDILKKFSNDNLKSMLSIHTNYSNNPGIIVDDLVFLLHMLLILIRFSFY
jgi:hypothetical protein